MKRFLMIGFFWQVFYCMGSGYPLYLSREISCKAITLTIGFPPGAGSDASLRYLAQAASKKLKQPVVVVNKEGARERWRLANSRTNYLTVIISLLCRPVQ